jgi:hypothetical protein
MGLLDDAIREHLELKRRRGADPGEVARAQREALDSAPRNEAAQAVEDPPIAEEAAPVEAPVDAPGVTPVGVVPVEADPVKASQVSGETVPTGGDETAELDMRSVLGEDGAGAQVDEESPGAVDGEAPLAVEARPVEENSLEWEVPGELADEPQEEGPAEDVLEETPDFLRDTPEQDRLWFEQRPPRDFDFDK